MSAPVLTRATYESAALPCPKWCDGSCESASSDVDRYHGSDFTDVSGIESHDHTNAVTFTLSVTQLDTEDDGRGDARLHVITGYNGEDFAFSPATARQLAAGLLNLADAADPLPVGVQQIRAEDIRVGDEIETPDGWQTGYMILVDSRAGHVAVFTDGRDDTDTDGWQYAFGDLLTVRRAVAR